MKIWKISQNENGGYDTYDAAIVAAETEEAARITMPSAYARFRELYGSTWCSGPEKVTVEYLGEARDGTPAGVILASFNAG